MIIPTHPFSLMSNAYKKIFPVVHQELSYWKKRAELIPNDELRKQALASIEHKTFHCEGGAILALIAKEAYPEVIRFIVAYQTISDYLDNLCDRSTSLDPNDFAALHEAMEHALTLGTLPQNYYRLRDDQEDGGYLQDLVLTCQNSLGKTNHYSIIKTYLLNLCRYYCDLQIHKHVKVEERLPRLQKWFEKHQPSLPSMEWYEFSACSGSTLGIFCLVSYAMQDEFSEEHAEAIWKGYFPYIQGLHILLDYFIDQEEDRIGGDLNFCFYYQDQENLLNRFIHFVQQADKQLDNIPHKKFHQLINRGLLGLYLSDNKVRGQKQVHILAKKILKAGGAVSYFFYVNGRLYRTLQKMYKWKIVNNG